MLALLFAACSPDPPAHFGVAASPLPARAVELLDAPVAGEVSPKLSDRWPASTGPAARTVTLKEDARPSLLAAEGVRWAFAVPRDAPARFRSGIGVVGKRETCFRVWVDASLATERCLPGGKKSWAELKVDLPIADGSSEIVLETTGPGAWGDPRVVPSTDDTRPDVVLLLFDTTRWDHLGRSGYTRRATTPTLDRWLDDALVYTQARSPAPWTAPSFASVLTGLDPSRHGAGARKAWVPKKRKESKNQHRLRSYTALGTNVTTLAEVLRGAGYDTVAFSANGFLSPAMGLDRGYGRFVQYRGSDYAAAENGVDEALGALKVRDGNPLLLTVHFIDPHHPYTMRFPTPDGFAQPTTLNLTDVKEGKRTAVALDGIDDVARAHPEDVQVLYDAELRWLDDQLAKLLPAIPPDALVVGLADHGEGFGEHGLFVHGNSLHDELLHVPLFVRWPGGSRAGTVDVPVSLVDVTPTVLSALTMPIPTGLSGRPLPLPGEDPPPRLTFAGTMYSGPDQTAALEGRWKYIFTHPTALGGEAGANATDAGSEALYDLAADPFETVDRSADAPDVFERLRLATRAHLSSTWPGIHVACRPEGLLDVKVTGTAIGRVSPLTTEPGDRLTLQAARLDGTIAPQAPGDVDEWALAPQLEEGTLVLQGPGFPGGSLRVALGKVPGAPEVPAAGACAVWEVGGAGREMDVDEGTADQLEQLGYIGG